MAQPHQTETRVDIGDISYYGYDGESGIWSLATRNALFENFSAGNCHAGTIDLTLVNPQSIPTMAKMEVYVRLTEEPWTDPELLELDEITGAGVSFGWSNPSTVRYSNAVIRSGDALSLPEDADEIIITADNTEAAQAVLRGKFFEIKSEFYDGGVLYGSPEMDVYYYPYDSPPHIRFSPSYYPENYSVKPLVHHRVTDWIRKGVYFIDTREWDARHEFLTITGFDAMLKAEQPYIISDATDPVILDEFTIPQGRMRGDVNGNGVIDADYVPYAEGGRSDNQITLAASVDKAHLDEIETWCADVDDDGWVTGTDSLKIDERANGTFGAYTNADYYGNWTWRDDTHDWFVFAAKTVPNGAVLILPDGFTYEEATGGINIICANPPLTEKTAQIAIFGWPRLDNLVALEVAMRIGVELDSRTVLNKGYMVQLPAVSTDGDESMTLREVLGYVGAMYGGNWIINDEGKLQLVTVPDKMFFRSTSNAQDLLIDGVIEAQIVGSARPKVGDIIVSADDVLLEVTTVHDPAVEPGFLRWVCIVEEAQGVMAPIDIGTDVIDVTTSPAYDAISRVRLVLNEETEYTAGDDTGRTIEIVCPWGTQAMANALLIALSGFAYQPLEATTATKADPLWELGDAVNVNGIYSQIVAMPTYFGLAYTADISAPNGEEINHEYPFVDKAQQEIKRIIAKTTASLRVDVDRIEGKVDGKITTYRQATVPTGAATGDLWYATADVSSYKAGTWYRYSGSTWEETSEAVSIPVAPAWETGTQYKKGDIVDSGGKWYAAKLNHTASSSNKPPNTAYWEEKSTISQVSSTQITQAIDRIELGVSSTSGGTKITLTSGETTIESNIVNIYGALTAQSMYVSDYFGNPLFLADANSGYVYLDSAVIGGTITAQQIRGNDIYIMDASGTTCGEIIPSDTTTGTGIELRTSSGGFRIQSAGNFYVETGAHTFISATPSTFSFGHADVIPSSSEDYNLGSASFKWAAVYAATGTIQTSDRERKTNINYDISNMDDFFDDLKPASFKFKNGTSNRTHYGLISQDVEDNLDDHGMAGTDFAGFCKDFDEDGKALYSLRYDEFIALCIDQIQKLKARVKSLEAESQ